MKDILKKWWFYAGIIILLIIIISVILIIKNNNKTIYYNYKIQAINILNKYNSGELDNETASKELKNISDKLYFEFETDKTTKSNILLSAMDLAYYCSSTSTDLKYNYATLSKIKDTIQKIEDLEL